MEPEFNPNSYTAVLSRILTKIEENEKRDEAKAAADAAAFKAIMAKQDLTNGRVRSLESFRTRLRGEYLGVAGVISVLTFIIANWSSIKVLFGS